MKYITTILLAFVSITNSYSQIKLKAINQKWCQCLQDKKADTLKFRTEYSEDCKYKKINNPYISNIKLEYTFLSDGTVNIYKEFGNMLRPDYEPEINCVSQVIKDTVVKSSGEIDIVDSTVLDCTSILFQPGMSGATVGSSTYKIDKKANELIVLGDKGKQLKYTIVKLDKNEMLVVDQTMHKSKLVDQFYSLPLDSAWDIEKNDSEVHYSLIDSFFYCQDLNPLRYRVLDLDTVKLDLRFEENWSDYKIDSIRIENNKTFEMISPKVVAALDEIDWAIMSTITREDVLTNSFEAYGFVGFVDNWTEEEEYRISQVKRLPDYVKNKVGVFMDLNIFCVEDEEIQNKIIKLRKMIYSQTAE